jgi:hypothetical protein
MDHQFIDMTKLKQLVSKLPKSEQMRKIILSEADSMTLYEFQIKASVWELLL